MGKKAMVLACMMLLGTMSFAPKLETLAAGTQYYVDVQNGSDENSGQMGAPFQTIQKACDVVGPGDTVTVAPGVYFEEVTLSTVGTKENPITFQAAEKDLHSVTITGAKKEIREKTVSWTLEDEALQLYSAPLDHQPVRMLYDDVDMVPYSTLSGLKSFVQYETPGESYLPGAKHGFYFDKGAGKVYVRLHPSGKYGSTNPNDHVMAVSPTLYESGYKGSGMGEGSYNFGIVTEGEAHVILDGFTFETPGFAGVYIRGTDVTVKNAYFRGCRSGIRGGSRKTNDAYSSDNVVIEHCDYTQYPAYDDVVEIIEEFSDGHDPLVAQNRFFWWQRKGMESNEGLQAKYDYEVGGFFVFPGENWIVRNNHVHDCFDGISHMGMTKYHKTISNQQYDEPTKNLKFYENRVERCVDNAMEFENRIDGLEIYHNEFYNNYMTFSWQPLNGKPWPQNIKIYKNIVYMSPEDGKMWLDKAKYGASWFKAGAKYDQWKWWTWMAEELIDQWKFPANPITPEGDGVLVYNNTVVTPYAYFLEKCNGHESICFDNFTFANNIFVTEVKDNKKHSASHKDIMNGDAIQNRTGFLFHHNLYCTSEYQENYVNDSLSLNGGYTLKDPRDIGFKDMENMRFELTDESPAVGAGVLLEGEAESSVDLGAIPYGQTWNSPIVGPEKQSNE